MRMTDATTVREVRVTGTDSGVRGRFSLQGVHDRATSEASVFVSFLATALRRAVYPSLGLALAASLAACSGGGSGAIPPAGGTISSPLSPTSDMITSHGDGTTTTPSGGTTPAPSGDHGAAPAPSSSSAPKTTGSVSSPVTGSAVPAASTPVTGGSASGYASIVNGQQWPLSFRPYSRYPWNNQLPANPANVDATNTNRLAVYMSHTETSTFPGQPGSNDFSKPVYFASNSDPVVSFNCGAAKYGCNQNFTSLHIPSRARPTGSSDAHMAVVEPDGTEYDFWQAQYNGGSSLSAGIGAVSSVLTTGIPARMSATSGASDAAGVIRFDEISSGTIPHALFVVMPCVNGLVYPGTSNGLSCPDGGGVPMGSHLYLAMSDAQIDALPSSTVPPAERPILHAFHQFGAFVLDTGGSGNGTEGSGFPVLSWESPTQYAAFGASFPGNAWAAANGYSQSGSMWTHVGINWAALRPYMKVLSNCYSQGACSN